MQEHPVLSAALAGFIFGNALCWLPGPINLTILNEGAQRGFKWGFFIGLGAATMDVAYCSVSFMGFSQFFEHRIIKAGMQVASFVFLLFLGCKFLFATTVHVATKLDAASEKLEARLEQKIHPHSAFATGLLRVAANLNVLAAWLVLAATLLAHDWVDTTLVAKTACVGGVAIGTALWFLFLSFVVSRGHGKFSEKTLLGLQHVSGLCLLAAAIYEGAQIAWHLSKHTF